MAVMEKKYYKPCKRRFHHKNPGVHVPASSMIFTLVKKVHSTGFFLDKEYTRQNAMTTKAI
jgi:hypothetical protein